LQRNELLKQLQRDYHFEFNVGDRIVRLLFDRKWWISFESIEDEDIFFMYATIAKIPVDQEVIVHKRALAGNLFGKETGEATLALHEDKRLLVLFQRFYEAKTDYDAFKRAVENLIAYLDYWQEKLQSHLEDVSDLQDHFRGLQRADDLQIFFA